MSQSTISLEDVSINRYHKLLTIQSGGGWFIDGYILSIIGVALIFFAKELHLNNFWQGMIAASAIIGICIGGILGGMLTDKYGRKKLFFVGPILFTVFSLIQFYAQSGELIFLSRVFIGIGVGIEYTVGSALLTEFLPKKSRGPRISALVTMWFIGAAVSYVVGNMIISYMGGAEGWRYVLASSAILGVVLIIIRLGVLESPRWLISKGRSKEADSIIKKVYGNSFSIDNLPREKASQKVSFKQLMKGGYGGRILFVSIFWACCVMPIFAVYSFAPKVLAALNLKGEMGAYGSIFITFLFVIGCVLGAIVINKMGRRRMLIQSFLWSLVALFGLGYFANASPLIVLFFFGAYAIFIGGAQILTIVYPNEIFPTEVRAVAIGLCTSLSKIGVVVGTWLVPYSVDTIGIANTMFAAAIINLVGLIVTCIYAIETSHLTLEEASKI